VGGGRRAVVLLFALLAFLYLPTRLIEEATPEWRPIQWALGIEAIGLTLCVAYMGKGRGWLRQVAFPICFFFVAIPWPTLIEAPVIQSLTRINSAITVEVLSWAGIPAMQHGNLIEVGTGTVGVSEACSGIRSFQTSLMISLFFGEFYRMGLWRRLLLVPAGFILAMAFNVCRMTFLTMVAAKKGVAAIAQYHDPAGITITVVCTAGLWGLAVLFKEKQKAEIRKVESGNPVGGGRWTGSGGRWTGSGGTVGCGETSEGKAENWKVESRNLGEAGIAEGRKTEIGKVESSNPVGGGRWTGSGGTAEGEKAEIGKVEYRNKEVENTKQKPEVGSQISTSCFPLSAFRSSSLLRLSFGLIVWLVVVEAGAALWYHSVESHLAPGPKWSVVFPSNNPTFTTLPIDADTRYLLRFDEGKQAAWTDSDGSRWEVFYYDWRSGRVAGYLAKRHTPEICLTATGWKMVAGPELTMMNINGVALPVRSYEFETAGDMLYVFHCRWEAGASANAYVAHESARFNLIRAIWAGRGNKGQKVLEVIISGCADARQAKAALARQLQTMIRVEKPKAEIWKAESRNKSSQRASTPN
jgi:exosortase